MNNLLLVIDAQNDFIIGPLGSERAVSIIPKIIEKINTFDGDVWFTCDSHDKNYLTTQEGKFLPVPHCIYGTDGEFINDEISDCIYPIVAKYFFKSTFGLAYDYIEYFAHENPSEIHIIGYVTDICVITNALLLKTALPETPIYVDASCCAGTSKAAHDAALLVMKSCQINVIGE